MAPQKQRSKKPPVSPGRPKGVPNKSTQVLKDAILMAAEQVGANGQGRDGLVGYLRRVATEDVKAFSTLLGKVLPMQIANEDGGPLQIVVKQFTLAD